MQREITRELVRRLLPGRMAESNKGSYGSVLAAAGSMAYRGAAALCTEGVLRGGAGLVYLASVEPVIQLVLSRTPECCACGCRTAANGGIHPQDADALRRRIREIENNKDATAVEQDLMTTLEVCYEFCLRGFHFEPIDIYRSDATKFVVTENGLLPQFTSVRGLGETAALDTVEKRKGKDFTSVEEFSLCCNKLSQTHIDQLRALGAFAGLPETSQLTLF